MPLDLHCLIDCAFSMPLLGWHCSSQFAHYAWMLRRCLLKCMHSRISKDTSCCNDFHTTEILLDQTWEISPAEYNFWYIHDLCTIYTHWHPAEEEKAPKSSCYTGKKCWYTDSCTITAWLRFNRCSLADRLKTMHAWVCDAVEGAILSSW